MRRHKKATKLSRDVSAALAVGDQLAQSLAKLLRAVARSPELKPQPVRVSDDKYWRRYY
jgi:hypothetical protein